jgi:hypothetical protein
MKLPRSQYGRNEAVNNYVVYPGFPPVENRVSFIGPLKGPWLGRRKENEE